MELLQLMPANWVIKGSFLSFKYTVGPDFEGSIGGRP